MGPTLWSEETPNFSHPSTKPSPGGFVKTEIAGPTHPEGSDSLGLWWGWRTGISKYVPRDIDANAVISTRGSHRPPGNVPQGQSSLPHTTVTKIIHDF